MRMPRVRVMVMTLHKLTAGDGYLYLVRQVAAADSTERGRSTLADYYSAKGETPGPLDGPRPGRPVRYRPVRSQRPGARTDLDRRGGLRCQRGADARPLRGGAAPQRRPHHGLRRRPRHGRPSDATPAGWDASSSSATANRSSRAAWRWPSAITTPKSGAHWNATIAPEVRARIRTRVAMNLFSEEYGRPPGRRPRTLRVHRPQHPRPHHRRRRLRPDVLTGEIGVGAVGDRPAVGGRTDRSRPRRGGGRRAGVAAGSRHVHPHRRRRGAPRSTPRDSSPRRSPTAIPAPVIPTCTPMSRSPTRCPMSTPMACAAGWRWTVNRCTGSRWRPRSCTTPAWKPT